MEDNRAEQLEALETFVEFNDRVVHNIKILIKELSGARLDDTDAFLDSIIQSINWEIQVINGTMEVLNEKTERIEKEKVNEKVVALSEALKAKEDKKLASAFEEILLVLEDIGQKAREVLA